MSKAPATDDRKSDEDTKCYSAKEPKVLAMGSTLITEIKERIGPSVDMMKEKVSPSIEACRGMFGSMDQQQNLRKRLVYYIVPPFGAALTFGATLLGAQPVSTASAAAAQVSHSLRRFCGQGTLKRENEYLSKESLLLNALVGVCAFKVLGGRFHNLMPSNVIHPGALHSVSIPARGSKYANDIEQTLIQDIFKRHGCHHCGKKAGECIADHICHQMLSAMGKKRRWSFISDEECRRLPTSQVSALELCG
ncbi:hypothetical protein R1flu_019682 [Riccia fluitans]|uniref:Uncharacterized protein n=1 Tax=Riccia fluitans TaxID=41844 RepID=A0ABD1ZJC7_9MARC